MTSPPLELRTLSPGGQTALEVASQLVEYLGAARRSLEIALYDVRLPGEPGDLVANALRQAHALEHPAHALAVRVAAELHDLRAGQLGRTRAVSH